MTEPWTNALRSACTFRCGDYGEPPCHEIVDGCEPCEECLTEVYGPIEKPEPRCPNTGELFGK